MKTNDILMLAGAAVAVYWLLNRQPGAARPVSTSSTSPELGVSVRTTRETRAYSDPFAPPAWLGGEDFYYSGGA